MTAVAVTSGLTRCPFTHERIDDWASQSLAPTTHALSDALLSFSVLADSVRRHEAIVVAVLADKRLSIRSSVG